MVSDKWQFCPEKECYYCKEGLSEVEKNSLGIITACYFCKRSFVE